MFDPQAPALGLSVGATNLAAVSTGHRPVVRPAEAMLHGQRLTGFVERIGDPVPLIAPDGSPLRPETLLDDALSALAQAATDGADAGDVTVAVPAHWHPALADTLRRALRLDIVSDAAAALTALNADPGLPGHGVVVLCDFGGSGASITLADAASDFSPIGETVRLPDFSGDLVDQALLRHVAASVTESGVDPVETAMVGALTRLRAECRAAKERLSADTATALLVDLPGRRTEFRLTRAELDGLMHGPLVDVLAAVDDTLLRNRIALAAVSAVATVGGGARIPLVTQLLSEHLRAPVVTTPTPQLTAARGAVLIAQRSRVADTATALAPAAPSPAIGALAWSQEDTSDVLFASAHTAHHIQPAEPRPALNFEPGQWQDTPPPRRAPLVAFGLAAAAAVVTTAVFGVMQFSDDTATPVEAATTVAPSQAPAAPVNTPAPPAPQAPPVSTVVVRPAQRAAAVPHRQAPVPRPVAPPVAAPPPATPAPPATTQAPPTTSTPPPTTSAPPPTAPSTPSEPPAAPPEEPPQSPEPPPVDPGSGNGDTPAEPPPADPVEVPPATPETEGAT